MKELRVATWNLARPLPGSVRAARLSAHIARADADIWVFTESHVAVDPGSAYELVARSTRLGAHDDECWVAIWSRVGGASVPCSDSDRSAVMRLEAVGSRPMTIYGSVLPWLGSRWRDHAATKGAAFAASLSLQATEWRAWAALGHLCVAGDFNQDLLSFGHYYGSRVNRSLLGTALEHASLTCPTSDAVSAHTGGELAGIDHICLTAGLAPSAESRIVWPARHERAGVLSDHFGISLRVSAS